MTHRRERPADRAGCGHSAGQSGTTSNIKTNKLSHNIPARTFIQVGKHYAIGADAHSWQILQRKRYRSDYRWEPVAWYGNINQRVRALADRAVLTSGAQALGEALAEAQRITSAICGALRPCFKMEERGHG
jgi:hypothetical protein